MTRKCHVRFARGVCGKVPNIHRIHGNSPLSYPTNEVGHRLACLLAPGPENAQVFRRGDDLYWRIPHTHRVDRLLTELTDLFISIRYAHPTLVQLELQLDEAAP